MLCLTVKHTQLSILYLSMLVKFWLIESHPSHLLSGIPTFINNNGNQFLRGNLETFREEKQNVKEREYFKEKRVTLASLKTMFI